MNNLTIDEWAAEAAATFPPLGPCVADRLCRLLVPEARGDLTNSTEDGTSIEAA